MLDALVIGNSVLDLVWSLDAPITIDGKVTASGLGRYAGGQAANAAYTLGNLGLSVEFIGCFGDDNAGDFCKQALRDAHVKLTAAQTRSGCRSQTSAVLVDAAEGTRTIAMYRPAPWGLSRDSSILDLAQNARLIYVDGYEPDIQLAALHAAAIAGRTRLTDIETASSATMALVNETDHLIVPANIVSQLAGTHDIVSAVRVLSAGTAHVAIATDGPRPFVVGCAGAVSTRHPPFVQAVDSTGVGDAFRAGYAAALLASRTLEECIETALATATQKLRSAGPRIIDEEAFAALRKKIGLERRLARVRTGDRL